MPTLHRSLGIAVVTLALGVSLGCQKKTEVELTGRSNNRSTETTAKKMDEAATDMRSSTERAGDKISDTAITAKVKSAIIGEPGLKALQINVDTVNGVVTLTGVVEAPQNVDQAVRVAQTVEGVKSVNNKLNVKASG